MVVVAVPEDEVAHEGEGGGEVVASGGGVEEEAASEHSNVNGSHHRRKRTSKSDRQTVLECARDRYCLSISIHCANTGSISTSYISTGTMAFTSVLLPGGPSARHRRTIHVLLERSKATVPFGSQSRVAFQTKRSAPKVSM